MRREPLPAAERSSVGCFVYECTSPVASPVAGEVVTYLYIITIRLFGDLTFISSE